MDMPFHYQNYWKRARWHLAAATAAQVHSDNILIEVSFRKLCKWGQKRGEMALESE